MELSGLFYFLILALLITSAFSFLFKVRGPWGSFWSFFIILLLAMMSADIWINPVGPYWNNVYFIPPLAVGLFVALILAAATPSPKAREEIKHEMEVSNKDSTATVAISSFFWIMLSFLLAIIALGIFI